VARPTLQTHPKFRRLVHTLQEPAPHVVGYLEVMWHVGYESGDPLLGDAVDVELAAQYPGPAGKLFQALLDCGFIELADCGRYSIHDLYDHAPEYVQRRAERETKRRLKGQTISDLRREAARKRWGNAGDMQTAATDGRLHANGATPAPAPAPAPREASPNGEESAEPTPKPPAAAEEFRRAWNAVPQFVPCRKMTGTRLKHFRARLADPDWAASWREALDRAARLPFCAGTNERGWRAKVDWFLRPDTVTKLLEGFYDDRPQAAHQGGRGNGQSISLRYHPERDDRSDNEGA
jgi:hypothetical protein